MRNKLLLLTIVLTSCFTSCIKDEPLFREADIVSFKIEGDAMISSNISLNKIQLVVRDNVDYRELKPVIEVSPGAKVSSESGVAVDFLKDQVYTVTSEDGNFQKEYIVSVSPTISTKYDFEDWTMAGALWKYPALTDISWSSANQGIMLAKTGKVDRYPTRDTTDVVSGKYAALLQTQNGGTYWGNKIPIFSGSLFRGKFAINMKDFVKSTKFGQIHPKENGKPLLFTGHYKYIPGKEFINKDGETVKDRIDECSIYSVIYKVTKGDEGKEEYLDGTNIMTSDKVIGKAILEDRRPDRENFVYRVFDTFCIFRGARL